MLVVEILAEPDAEYEGLGLVDGIEDVVAETVPDPESDEDGVEDSDAEIECVALAEGVPVRLVVGDPEIVAETVAVHVDVIVPEFVAEPVVVRVVVTDAVPECVADVEAVSLGDGVPVRDVVLDTVLVRETEADAVAVEAADAEVVADVVFVAECVSGPLVSVAVVVCDAETETERLEDGVADHVLDGVAVNVAAADADPETVEVRDVEIEREPVGEIVDERVVLTVLEVVELTECERVPFADADEDTEFVSFVEGVPEKVDFTVGDPDAEIEDDRVDDLDAVFVGEPEFVLEVVAVAEIERVAEIVRV